jgi:hypothetical protein
MTSLQLPRLRSAVGVLPHTLRTPQRKPSENLSNTLTIIARSRTQVSARRARHTICVRPTRRSSSVRRQTWMPPRTAWCANLEPPIEALSACCLRLCPRIVLSKPNVGKHSIRMAQHGEGNMHVRCNSCETPTMPTKALWRMSTLFAICREGIRSTVPVGGL